MSRYWQVQSGDVPAMVEAANYDEASGVLRGCVFAHGASLPVPRGRVRVVSGEGIGKTLVVVGVLVYTDGNWYVPVLDEVAPLSASSPYFVPLENVERVP